MLVHSFFDFTLHTTANALCFLVLAALATVNGRVEEEAKPEDAPRRRKRRRRRGNLAGADYVAPKGAVAPAPAPEAEGEGAAG